MQTQPASAENPSANANCGQSIAASPVATRSGFIVLLAFALLLLTALQRIVRRIAWLPDFWVRITTPEGIELKRYPPPKYGWADPDYAVGQVAVVPTKMCSNSHGTR